jgi:hypothetical protein
VSPRRRRGPAVQARAVGRPTSASRSRYWTPRSVSHGCRRPQHFRPGARSGRGAAAQPQRAASRRIRVRAGTRLSTRSRLQRTRSSCAASESCLSTNAGAPCDFIVCSLTRRFRPTRVQAHRAARRPLVSAKAPAWWVSREIAPGRCSRPAPPAASTQLRRPRRAEGDDAQRPSAQVDIAHHSVAVEAIPAAGRIAGQL